MLSTVRLMLHFNSENKKVNCVSKVQLNVSSDCKQSIYCFGLFRKTPQVSIAGCATIHIKHILQKIKGVIRRFNDGIRVNAHFPHA